MYHFFVQISTKAIYHCELHMVIFPLLHLIFLIRSKALQNQTGTIGMAGCCGSKAYCFLPAHQIYVNLTVAVFPSLNSNA